MDEPIGLTWHFTCTAAPTFCKCTCFTNSTIIEIKPKSSKGGSPSSPPSQHQPPSEGGSTTDPPASDDDGAKEGDDQDALGGASFEDDAAAADVANARRLARRAQGSSSSPSCSQCNRSFCLSQSLPICKGAADKDVSTMCFQRDSRKDQVIVWGFILGTAGLLGWAAVQKAVDMRQRGGGVPGIPGVGGGVAPRGRREGGGILPLGRGALGSTGTDGGRGAYAAVAGHSRESSLQTN